MSETTATNNVTTEKKDFEIVIEQHERFDHIMDCKFLSSTDLCTIISKLFKAIYADFEGCNFEIPQGTNALTISLFFNHTNNSGSSLPNACSKDIPDEKTINKTLRSTRIYQRTALYGDRFYLTDEGKGGLDEFVIDNRNFLTKDNKTNWGKLVSEVADTNGLINSIPSQYTKVSFLDPAKIMAKIFGETDENGTTWVYGVRILRSVPTVNMNGYVASNNYMLAVERVCEEEVVKLSQQMGYSVASGLNIIR